MSKSYLITGTSRGLGKALCEEILSTEPEARIFSLGRSTNAILCSNKQFRHIQIDLDDTTRLTEVLEQWSPKLEASNQLIFINNAGTISPITSIGQMSVEDLTRSVNVNVTAPAIISNYLLRVCSNSKLIFVNVSSGAATRVIDGWAAYCSAKAYAKMFFDVLAEQVKNNENIRVIQINPGVMDTDMQKEIRSADAQNFPEHTRFVQLRENGKLLSAATAAHNLLNQLRA